MGVVSRPCSYTCRVIEKRVLSCTSVQHEASVTAREGHTRVRKCAAPERLACVHRSPCSVCARLVAGMRWQASGASEAFVAACWCAACQRPTVAPVAPAHAPQGPAAWRAGCVGLCCAWHSSTATEPVAAQSGAVRRCVLFSCPLTTPSGLLPAGARVQGCTARAVACADACVQQQLP